jgi:N-formylglutamate amidohydrolase
VSAGLGTIARVVACGAEIYRGKLTYSEAERRIAELYRPYHAALGHLIDETFDRFGCCLLVDCHSMPSIGGPNDADSGASRVDFVLGDCHGTSCSPMVTAVAEAALERQGYRVVRNTPYAGGFSTRNYGQPRRHRHALQIEVNRRLYMNETTHAKHPDFTRLRADLAAVVAALTAMTPKELRP